MTRDKDRHPTVSHSVVPCSDFGSQNLYFPFVVRPESPWFLSARVGRTEAVSGLVVSGSCRTLVRCLQFGETEA